MDKPLLELLHISKTFPGVKALDDVSVNILPGEVHALLGENGAGKSTLLKILSGAYTLDEGEILLGGKPIFGKGVTHDAPTVAAEKAGVSIIYQELNYLPDLSVAENLYLGHLPKTKFGTIDWKTMYKGAEKILAVLGEAGAYGIDVKQDESELTVMQKQLVEIAKALSKDMKVLVMDEPTSSLNDNEVMALVKTVKTIVKRGVSVIFISHRLDEVFLVADRVTVMRDGKVIGTTNVNETNKDELIKMMVGRDLSDIFDKQTTPQDKVLLEVEGLETSYIKDVSFKLRQSEVLGLFGLLGAGREDALEAVFGKTRKTKGTIKVEGKEVTIKKPQDAIDAGIAYVPAERKTDGAVLIQPVRENISMSSLNQISHAGIINFPKEREIANNWVESFSIKAPSIETLLESLSGGNQQKVIISRWMQTKPKILLLNDPTRGIDVGAKAEIYKIIDRLCKDGAGVVLISSDMPELISLSDTIVAMSEGRVVGALTRAEATQEKLMSMVAV